MKRIASATVIASLALMALPVQAADTGFATQVAGAVAYLFSRQWSLQQTEALAETLALMERRQPHNADVVALRAKYQMLLAGSARKAPLAGE